MDRTVAMFSHAGSSSAVLSHMFGIPFPNFFRTFHPDFTSVTVVEMIGENGSLTYPRFEIATDARHIKGIEGTKTVPQN